VKFTKSDRATGGVAYAHFPSIVAPYHGMVGGAVEGDGARGRNVVPVEHKGMRFLVGPDVVSELGDSDIGRDISVKEAGAKASAALPGEGHDRATQQKIKRWLV
jgi:hypothetical protein